MTTVILVIAVLFITFLARLSAAESGASVVDSDYIDELDPLAKMPACDPMQTFPMIKDPADPVSALYVPEWDPYDGTMQ